MKQKQTELKILSLVAILLLCGNLFVWFGLTLLPTDQDETTEIVVTQVPIADLAAVLISNEQLSLGVLQEKGSFEILTTDTGDFDTSQILAMVYTLCNITADATFTDPATFAQYGIDTPTAQATLFLADGTEYTLQLLDEAAIAGSHYLYDPQTETVYLVGSLLGDMLGSGYSYYYTKTVFPVVTTSNYLDIGTISLDFGADDPRNYTITQKNGTFYLTAPITQQLSAVTMLSQLVSYLSALYAEEVLATDADLADYGLDNPDLVVTMTMGGETYQGALLSQDDNSVLLANLDTNSVYRVEDANYAMIASDYTGLLGGICFSLAMGDLSRLQFTTPAQSLSVDVQAVDASVELSIQGMALAQEEMVAMVDALNSVTLANVVQTPATADPALTLTATYSNGTQGIFTFTANQTGGYDVGIHGVTNFATTQGAVDALLDLVAQYTT